VSVYKSTVCLTRSSFSTGPACPTSMSRFFSLKEAIVFNLPKRDTLLWILSIQRGVAVRQCCVSSMRHVDLENVQEKRRAAQRIALQAASKVLGQTRVIETMAGGVRRVVPSGAVTNAESQAAFLMAAQSAASKIAGDMGMRMSRDAAVRMQAMQQAAAMKPTVGTQEYFEADLVINDFPQAARYHVTHRDTIAQVAERTGAAVSRSCMLATA
jgi:hypothetical protein